MSGAGGRTNSVQVEMLTRRMAREPPERWLLAKLQTYRCVSVFGVRVARGAESLSRLDGE